MRVNLYGNVCNNAYVIAKFLRRQGIDAHLFLERNFPWRPEQDEPDLLGNYPEWLHVVGDLRYRRYGLFDRSFVRRLGECDLIHTFYYGPIWARQTGRPFVFQTYGGDLNLLPFMSDSLHHRYLSLRQRHGLRAAACVFLTMPNNVYCNEAVARLGLRRTLFMPLALDTTLCAPRPESEVREVRGRYPHEFVFFHPTRQAWATTPWLDRKGNDRLFRAFAKFVRDGRDALLLAVRHGPDVAASERLVAELGIGASVRWLAPMPRHELMLLYCVADAVFDQFLVGDFGTSAAEAWSCAKPVFIHLQGSYAMLGSEPPAVNVHTEQEIYTRLVEYARDPKTFQEIGRRARRWVQEHLDGRVVVRRYLEVYETMLADSDGRAMPPAGRVRV